jgi:ankyrin repeat protein
MAGPDEQELISAAGRGDVAAVNALLAKGVDVNAVGTGFQDGVTALMEASREGHLDVVQALLATGADVNLHAASSAYALGCAIVEGHLDVVQALLAKGADPNDRDSSGSNALGLAELNPEISALLLRAGAIPPGRFVIGS